MNNQMISAISSKIKLNHLERLAYIYVRQSTQKQVDKNRESQLYQYRLSQRARDLGWSADRIRVIDTDLGLSGKGSSYRDGFQELVAEVSLRHVGIIFGYEVSRLARNNCDWYHLLDLAAVFGTLIADADGIYDPCLYNDRLLLGLKGTMSEAELHLLKMRLDAGRMNQIQRGVYHQALPTGLIRLPDGTVVKDPDQQIQHIIEMVFQKFAELGSCRQALRYLKQENILLPRRHTLGQHAGELIWRPPTDSMLNDILHNPAYAGAFAYGRRQADPSLRKPQRPYTGLTRRSIKDWLHIEQNVYPAYISWEQYLINQEKLAENFTLLVWKKQNHRGPAREGSALLQGLAMCGLCGARMRVSYKKTHRYDCCNLKDRVLGNKCVSLYGESLDQAVEEAFLEALRPAQLDALEAILAQQINEHERLERRWQEQLRRAKYEVRLAQRQYNAVDPDHRLVAAELERRWEEKLKELREVEENFARFHKRLSIPTLTQEQRIQFQHLSETLPEIWASGAITFTQKKEFLRCLISQVILKRLAPDQIEMRIVWVSGYFSIVVIQPPIHKERDVTGYDLMVERIHQLWQQGVTTDLEIAKILSKEGFHSARSNVVTNKSVMKIRFEHGWHTTFHQTRNAESLGEYFTIKGLAAKLGVSRYWVRRRIKTGIIESVYVIHNGYGWLIKDAPLLIAKLKASC